MGGQSRGNWFSSGYHGHFRSKPRSDFTNRYRQDCKPPPPQDFVRKLQECPNVHNFSHHDNRFSFLNTVTSFQDGLGKKKVSNRNGNKFQPDFIAWIPHAKEINHAGPNISIYRDTHRGSDRAAISQSLVESVKKYRSTPNIDLKITGIQSPYIDLKHYNTAPIQTTYQMVHQHSQPNISVNTNMNTGFIDPVQLPVESTNRYVNPRIPSVYNVPRRLRRSRVSSAPVLRSSVAQCLVWQNYGDNDRLPDLGRPKTAMAALPPVTAVLEDSREDGTSEMDGKEPT